MEWKCQLGELCTSTFSEQLFKNTFQVVISGFWWGFCLCKYIWARVKLDITLDLSSATEWFIFSFRWFADNLLLLSRCAITTHNKYNARLILFKEVYSRFQEDLNISTYKTGFIGLLAPYLKHASEKTDDCVYIYLFIYYLQLWRGRVGEDTRTELS